MQRMIQAGVVPVTWQQVMLEWQRDWAHRDTYDAVMNIVREHSGAYGMGVDYAYTMVHKAPERSQARCPAGPGRRNQNGRRVIREQDRPAVSFPRREVAMKAYLITLAVGLLVGAIGSKNEDGHMTDPNRRDVITGATALGLTALMGTPAMGQTTTADLILHHGKFTTLDRSQPRSAGGGDHRRPLLRRRRHDRHHGDEGPGHDGDRPQAARRAIPGLIDNHIHIIRGGLNFNMELRWDGVRRLADAMAMLKRQVANTPPPQWVRVVGGFTEHQFAEKRLPTHRGDQRGRARHARVHPAPLRPRAAECARRCGPSATPRTRRTRRAARSCATPQGNPTGLLLAKPNAGILYATLAKGPKLPFEYQVNSTRHFMRELNRLGVTGAIDAGGGFQNYPDDYAVIEKLHEDGQLTHPPRLQPLHPEAEGGEGGLPATGPARRSTSRATTTSARTAPARCWCSRPPISRISASPRPDMPPEMEGELEEVVRILAQNRWPWRLHATYDETISPRARRVREGERRTSRSRVCTGSSTTPRRSREQSIDRIAALGGGIAVQHRMAYQGEYFVERYGLGAAERRRRSRGCWTKGVKISAGTDATRVASYNPWVSLSWLVTGKTVGGLRLYPQRNCLDRETALRMWTENVTWFSNEEGKKGRIKVGQLADLVVPDRDYFVPVPNDIADTCNPS